MIRITNYVLLFALLMLVVGGCSRDYSPVDSQAPADVGRAAAPGLSLAAEDTFKSATLYVNVIEPSGQPVNVHRITNSWEEMTVTWNNFAAAFAPETWGSFTADGADWRSTDVTALVQAWMNGTYDNYGFLLDQFDPDYPRTKYFSREASANQPYLEVCYETDGGEECTNIFPVADAYIFEYTPDENRGDSPFLYTGRYEEGGPEKQTLIRFELPVMPELAAIGDFVWHDENMDGIQDGGEAGVAGVTVNLYDCEDVLLATTVTDGSGYYLFSDLTPGGYYVEFVLPMGYVFSPKDQGMDDAMDSDADLMTGKTECTTLDAGETDLTWDAGIYMPVQEGCTHTIGYWKTHAGFGPQDDVVTPLLPIWLGTAGGSKSLAVTTAAIAVDVLEMKTYGKNSNGITKLYAQLLGAKLSIASGASGSDVDDIIADADAFLADHDWMDWDGLSDEDRQMVLDWQGTLDDYNNGDIGPGHCDEIDGHSQEFDNR
ncbi:MAG TPA: SdrD B-like domain-containing protein [Acidobacteriota bacterium]|nr:SdrD B-like domain-containing protein [Acidobacteriota bacterium]